MQKALESDAQEAKGGGGGGELGGVNKKTRPAW